MVAMEASSHGLEQGRLTATAIDTAIFTNLTRDHLDYHGSMDAYQQAKGLLFQWPTLKTAIFNADDPAYLAYQALILPSFVFIESCFFETPPSNVAPASGSLSFHFLIFKYFSKRF